MKRLSIVVYGAPRTKKNSNRLVTVRGRKIVLPSKAYKDWEKGAIIKLVSAADGFPWGATPCNLSAIFYRDANRGDLVGYVQGIQDLLTARGVWADDSCVRSLDGCRLSVDRESPRVEIELTDMDAWKELWSSDG